jgi:subtilisin family serine protease
VAVAMAYQAATNSSTIVVGALSGSGSSENIATYSTRAGVLAQRFIMASGEQGETNVAGTSFAAPRVAGVAAILKQKYPTLTSAQIANVILLSAIKDINNDGTDDFVGVSPIFGHGKVSLSRALALAGAL